MGKYTDLLNNAILDALKSGPVKIPLSTNVSRPSAPASPAAPSVSGPEKKELNVTSPYGERTLDGKTKMHHGHDIGIGLGHPVFAVDSGTVAFSGWQDPRNPQIGGGLYVKIEHANGKESFYMHLDKSLVQVGSQVNKGQQIGEAGNTGAVHGKHGGYHLHLEMREKVEGEPRGKSRPPTAEETRIAQNGQ